MKAIPSTNKREGWTRRVLGLIRGCHLALSQAKEELPLLQEMCRLLVDLGGYPLASVALVEDEKSKKIHRVAQAGLALSFLDLLPATWDVEGPSQDPTVTAIRTGQPAFCSDIQSEPACAPYAEVAETLGLSSCLALPLSHQGRVFGALTLYVSGPGAFSADERDFLRTLTAFFCQGITNLSHKADLAGMASELADKIQMLESFPLPILVLDLEGTILWLNQAALELHGFTREDLLGMNEGTLEVPEFRKLREEHRQRLISLGEAVCESAHLRRDRTFFPVKIHSRMIDFKGDKAILSMVVDLTEGKRQEEILRETEERFSNIFRNTQDGIFRWRISDGRMLDCNDQMAHMFGYDAKEDLLRDFVARNHFVEPDTKERMLEAAQNGQLRNFALRFFRQDGSIVWLRCSARIYADRDYLEGVATDITELRQAKDSLERTTEQHQTLVEHLLGRTLLFSIEQQQLNNEIQQERDLYEKMLGHSEDGVVGFDQDLNVTLWSPSMEHFTGLSKNKVLGKNLLRVLPFLREINEKSPILGGGKPREFFKQDQPQKLTATGPEGFYAGYLAPLINEEDEVYGGVLFVRDNTAVRRTENAVHEQQVLLEGILASTEEGVAVLDRNLTFVRVNPIMEKWFAHDEPLLGKKCHAVIHGALDPCENCPALKTLVNGEPAHAVVPKTGSREDDSGWVDLFSYPLYDSRTGKTAGVILRIKDITAKLKDEASLQEGRTCLNLLVNLLPVAIGRLDRGGTITFWENNIEDLTGYSPAEFAPGGRPWSQVILEEDQGHAREVFLQALGTDLHTYVRQYRVKTKDGRIIWFQERGQIARDSQGRALYTDIVFLDITDQKQLEEVGIPSEIRGSSEPRLDAIGSLAGAIGHDFNNILGVMLGYTEMALMSLEEKEILQHRLQQVLKAGKRGKELVSQILSLSRPSPPERRPVHLSTIVKEALHTLRATLPSNIELKMRLEEDQDTILVDSTQMQRVIITLCTNAAQAMRDRGGLLDISVSMVHLDAKTAVQLPGLFPGPHLLLSIKDTGQGIDQDSLEKIFDFSFSDKKLDEGIRLGLAAVQTIIAMHKGIITVQSEVGKGTEFLIYLPWVEASRVHEGAKPAALENGSQSLLLVDDEEWLVDMWKEILESLGYRTTATTRSLQALQLVKEKPYAFDLVIVDQTMPQMTGLELAEELTALRPDLPVILITSFSALVSPEKGEKAGIREYIMKPLSISELTNAIRRVLGKEPQREKAK